MLLPTCPEAFDASCPKRRLENIFLEEELLNSCVEKPTDLGALRLSLLLAKFYLVFFSHEKDVLGDDSRERPGLCVCFIGDTTTC